MRGRVRRRISNETVKDVAFAVVEAESGSQYFASSARRVSYDLSLLWSTVRKILRSILKWHPYKISFVQQLNPAELEELLYFAAIFLSRIIVDNE